jgi:hypothetical protein
VWFFKKIAIRGRTLQDRQANNVFFRKNAKVNSNKTIFFFRKICFARYVATIGNHGNNTFTLTKK